VYRRTRTQMPAHEFEVQDAEEEGIQFRWLSTIKEMGESTLTLERMTLDENGKPQPTGELETIEGDTLVLAMGQNGDLTIPEKVPGIEIEDRVVKVERRMMTGCEGIFAGGGMVPSERTVTVAVGHGKKAARHIDAYLRGTTYVAPPKHELASYDTLNTWYYTNAPKRLQPVLDRARRQSTFAEVVGGLDVTNALNEARRCMSCGNCFGVCPDNAIVELGPRRRFQTNYDFCKGCSMCAAECPCGAIEKVPEEI
jgi:2-oxoacid:acceptor oxidoreductase delta subunit (pyruvate/2-ketoisovalerate family)